MEKKFVAIALIFTLLCTLSADAFSLKKNQKPKINYSAWVAASGLPASYQGVEVFYPQTSLPDSLAVIQGSIPVKGLTAQQIMCAALIYAAENLNAEKENIESVNFSDNTFSVFLSSTQGENNNETTFKRMLTVSPEKGLLKFVVSDMGVKYRLKGLIPRTVKAEDLHPDSDTRHNELVMELSNVNAEYLHKMAEYASSRSDIKITHFQEIMDGTVTKGMTPDEVILAKGPARDIRKSGERIRWIYNNEYVVIFTDGVVSKVIQ